ncbi:MAG: hypothetical protein ACREB9_05585 [Thermoplasmata archaeon]
MTEITLAFLPRLAHDVMDGKKLTTIRRTKHGRVGDIFYLEFAHSVPGAVQFNVPGAVQFAFEIIAIQEVALMGAIAGEVDIARGLANAGILRWPLYVADHWRDLFDCYGKECPGPLDTVYLHEFRARPDLSRGPSGIIPVSKP